MSAITTKPTEISPAIDRSYERLTQIFDDLVDDNDTFIGECITDKFWTYVCPHHAEVYGELGHLDADACDATCGVRGCQQPSAYYLTMVGVVTGEGVPMGEDDIANATQARIERTITALRELGETNNILLWNAYCKATHQEYNRINAINEQNIIRHFDNHINLLFAQCGMNFPFEDYAYFTGSVTATVFLKGSIYDDTYYNPFNETLLGQWLLASNTTDLQVNGVPDDLINDLFVGAIICHIVDF